MILRERHVCPSVFSFKVYSAELEKHTVTYTTNKTRENNADKLPYLLSSLGPLDKSAEEPDIISNFKSNSSLPK